MRRTAHVAMLAAALAACRPLPTSKAAPDGELARAAHVPVRIHFEPPLPEAGELVVEHESGERQRVSAPPSGVDLTLPVGPATARLEHGGELFTTTLRVPPEGGTIAWRWSR